MRKNFVKMNSIASADTALVKSNHSESHHKRNWPFLLIRVTVGLVLLIVLCWSIDLQTVATSFTAIRPVTFIALCIMAVIDRGLMAYKWNLLLRAYRISISVWQATRLYVVGMLLGTFTPGALGIEAYRVMGLSRFQKTQVVISTILIERVIGIVVIGAFAAAGLPVSLKYLNTSSVFLKWTVIVGAASAVLLLLMSLQPSFVEGVARRIPYLSRITLVKKLQDFYLVYAESRSHWRTLLAFTALTALEVLVLVSLTYFAARSLDIRISYAYLICTMPLLLILLRLPISIAGIGVQEGLFAYLFVIAGFTAADGLSISLLLRAVGFAVVQVPACFMYWLKPVRPEPNHFSH